MIKTSSENDCVGCEHCINCGRDKDYLVVDNLICDKCGNDADELYVVDGKQICIKCLKADYDEINDDNFEDYL